MTWRILLLLCFLPCASALDLVRYTDAIKAHQNPNNQYFITLLQEALNVTQAEFGGYELQAVDVVISQDRQIRELEKGTFDVFWTMTTPARELDALAVAEPLIKGAYGIRLLVTHRHYLEQVSQRTNLPAWRAVPVLSGTDWPDTAILRLNHFMVTTELFEKDLYQKLLQSQKFVFPRGLLEAQAELTARDNADLVLVPGVVLRYPAVMKFFVSRHNTRLAERLTAGIRLLKQSGRFDEIFYQFAPHAEALAQLPLRNARIIELRSPFVLSADAAAAVRAEQDALLVKLGVNTSAEH